MPETSSETVIPWPACDEDFVVAQELAAEEGMEVGVDLVAAIVDLGAEPPADLAAEALTIVEIDGSTRDIEIVYVGVNIGKARDRLDEEAVLQPSPDSRPRHARPVKGHRCFRVAAEIEVDIVGNWPLARGLSK